MTDVVQLPVVQALAWALVHFLWQGAAIALTAYAAFRIVGRSASLRYAIGVGALAAMLAAPVATFLTLAGEQARPAAATPVVARDTGVVVPQGLPAQPTSAPSTASSAFRFRVTPEALAVAVFVWFVGVTFFSIRLLGGWMMARRFGRRAVQPASETIQTLARQLADRLAVRRAVTILESSFVLVPVMVGWLKPTVVLPMAALSGLSPAQVEALLAHELAHVRRHDYLVNLLQSVAEALLFYHPGVWWLSRRVRAERELCCDDLALGVCDRLVYATALTDLAAMASPRVALAATDGHLLGRVRRILGHRDETPTVRPGVMPVLALALIAGIAVPVALASATQAPAATTPQTQVAAADTPSSQPQIAIDANSIDVVGGGLSIHARGHLSVEQTPPTGTRTTPQIAPPPAAQQTAQQQAEQRRVADLRRKFEELRKELAQVGAARAEELKTKAEELRTNAADMSKKALEQTQAAREAELQAARKRVEDATKRFEAGLISEAQLLEAKAALAKVEAQGDAAAAVAAELQAVRARLDRSGLLVERGLTASRDTAQLEAALKALDLRMADVTELTREKLAEAAQAARASASVSSADAKRLQELVTARLMTSGLDQQKAALQALGAQIDKMAQGRLEVRPEPVTNAAEPVKAGDVLRITISGEPDLPASYRVGDDGTIRMPFLGEIKVVGLTAAQVRDAVGKQLSAKKLGSVAQVTVMVTRAFRPK